MELWSFTMIYVCDILSVSMYIIYSLNVHYIIKLDVICFNTIQLLHFLECDKMCYGALKSNIDQGRNTSYCTKWSAVIVLLHLTFPVFVVYLDHFLRIVCLFFFKFKNIWPDPFNIIDTCTNSVCTNLYY